MSKPGALERALEYLGHWDGDPTLSADEKAVIRALKAAKRDRAMLDWVIRKTGWTRKLIRQYMNEAARRK